MELDPSHDWVAHAILGTRVDAVQASAKSFGGYCIWTFSQLKTPFKMFLCPNTVSSGGICEMFAAKWLEQHAKGGSIVNWITKADGDMIDANKVHQLIQLFALGSRACSGSKGGHLQSHTQSHSGATEAWLRSHGVIKRRQLAGNTELTGSNGSALKRKACNSGGGVSRRNFVGDIAKQVVQSSGSYKIISIEGACFGHAMAAWSDQDVSFFDPNFGEFWFASPQDFIAWSEVFWHLAGYDMPMLGAGERYAIQEYGTPANR